MLVYILLECHKSETSKFQSVRPVLFDKEMLVAKWENLGSPYPENQQFYF